MKRIIFCLLFFSILKISFAQECSGDNLFSQLNEKAIEASVHLMNQSVHNEVEKKLRSFKIQTENLAQQGTSKDSLIQWYQNMVAMNEAAFEAVNSFAFLKDDKEKKRFAAFLVNTIVATWIGRAGYAVAHENAHKDAVIAQGGNSWITTTNHVYEKMTNGQLFLATVIADGRPMAAYQFNQIPDAKTLAIISGAGLNTQNAIADKISDQSLKKGQMTSTDLTYYLINRTNIATYYIYDHSSGLSDISSYVKALKDQDKISASEVDQTMQNLAKYSALTAILSGRTWEGLKAAKNYLQGGDDKAETIKIKTPVGDLSWPDFSTYLNSDNISIKARTDLSKGQTTYHASVEQSVAGTHVQEVGVGVFKKFERSSVDVTALANSQGGKGLRFELAYDVSGNGRWYVYAAGSVDQGTLDGMRDSHTTDTTLKRKFYSGLEYKY